MKEKKNVDDLTKLATYHVFIEEIGGMLEDADAQVKPLSLAFLDCDFFKKVNDTYGHNAGDEVLIDLAGHVEKSIGNKGKVFRYGGEEFVIVMPGLEKEEAFLLMEETRKTYSGKYEFTIKKKKEKCEMTISIGVSSFRIDAENEKDLLRKADEALYRAKKTGRNRVCLARDEKMVTKTSYYSQGQLMRLSKLAKDQGVGEAVLLRESLDDLLKKYLLYDKKMSKRNKK